MAERKKPAKANTMEAGEATGVAKAKTKPTAARRSPKAKHVIPRTASEAADKGHAAVAAARIGLESTAAVRATRVHLSAADAKPGDVAWFGPCERKTRTRVVCYYDQAMQPTDCRNVPC